MLALNSVSRWYGEVCALDRLSMSIPDNCYVSVLGGSGSGKTTLLRIIAGFEEQDEGTVALNEARLDGTPPHRRGIGFVFQNFALFPIFPFSTISLSAGVIGKRAPSATRP